MKFLIHLQVRGASALVHPVIYGHPSPMTFVLWSHALTRDLTQSNFDFLNKNISFYDVFKDVTVSIGLVKLSFRGEKLKYNKTKKWGWFKWHTRRSGERTLNSTHSPDQAMGDDPRLDGEWQLLLDLPDILFKDTANQENTQDFLKKWLKGWVLSHRLAGGFVGEQTLNVDEFDVKLLNQDAWFMDENKKDTDKSEIKNFIKDINYSPFYSKNKMPTVMGYQLLEDPISRKGARKNFSHAYTDAILNVVKWVKPKILNPEESPLPAWRFIQKDEEQVFLAQVKPYIVPYHEF